MPSDIINIGGAHIKPTRPLPPNVKKFLDESTDGAIYNTLVYEHFYKAQKCQKKKWKHF